MLGVVTGFAGQLVSTDAMSTNAGPRHECLVHTKPDTPVSIASSSIDTILLDLSPEESPDCTLHARSHSLPRLLFSDEKPASARGKWFCVVRHKNGRSFSTA